MRPRSLQAALLPVPILLVLLLVTLVAPTGCVVVQPHPHPNHGPPPGPRGGGMNASEAGARAQEYASRRGYESRVDYIDRDPGSYAVTLKVNGRGWKGRMRLRVDAYSGAVAVLEEAVRESHGRPHDSRAHWD